MTALERTQACLDHIERHNEKINAFINSPNWEFYLNACRSHGFMVDQEMPWLFSSLN